MRLTQAPTASPIPTWAFIQAVETDFGRVIGSIIARLVTSWAQMPMARLTLKSTV